MTEQQWRQLIDVINGRTFEPLPVGFMAGSPWFAHWAGLSLMDYFTSEELWFQANLKAVQTFPQVLFLPGFWPEFGMCTEPSAFGSKCAWQEEELPFPHKIITDINQIDSLEKPNPACDGLPPFALKRLRHYQSHIEAAGHSIKMAASRGPATIASFLTGATEFLLALKTHPEQAHKLLDVVTDFIVDWLQLQLDTFPSIDGVLILDDIVGFLGEQDFKTMVLPYLRRIFQTLKVTVKFFHNDSPGLVCAPWLPEIGVNLFNFSFNHSLAQMKELTGNKVTLMGNIPPRDVLAAGSPLLVRQTAAAALDSIADKSRLILSCGGGMPMGASTENILALLAAAKISK